MRKQGEILEWSSGHTTLAWGYPLGFPFVDTHGLARTATWPGDLFENKKAEGTKLLWGSSAGAWPPASKAEKQLIDAAMVSASVASDGRQPTKGF